MLSNIVIALDALILPEQFQALTANCTTDAQLRTTLKNALEPIEAELATQQSRQKCAISVVLDNTPGIIASDIADNGDTMVLADVHPIPRPYSADPTLKAQWESEHPDDIQGDEFDEQNLDDEPR